MAKQQIVKAASNKPVPLKVPESMSSFAQPVALEGGFGVNSPYVQFVHRLAKNYVTLSKQIKGIDDSTIALVYPNNTKPPIKLDPFRFAPVNFNQFWADLDSQGQIIKAYLDKESKPKTAKEHIDTVCIVYGDNFAEVARCMFKTTKSKLGHIGSRTLELAEDNDAWAGQGEEYANTLKMGDLAYTRFYIECELFKRTVNSPGSQSHGMPYYEGKGTPMPTTSTEWKKLGELFNDPDFDKRMEACKADFLARVDFVASKA